MRNIFLIPTVRACVFGMITIYAAEVVIKLRPPIAIHETRTVRPSPRGMCGLLATIDGTAMLTLVGKGQVGRTATRAFGLGCPPLYS